MPPAHESDPQVDQRPPPAASLFRSFALSGTLWAVVAATAALLVMLSLATGIGPGLSALGAGRLNAAYIRAAFFGAISLPLAGALLAATGGFGLAGAPIHHARRGLWLWNGGLGLGLLAILFLDAWPDRWGLRPEVWAAAPALADGLLWLGALLWLWALWSTAASAPDPLPVAAWFGLAAAIGLVVCLGLGLALLGSVSGASQAIAGTLYQPGLVLLWAAPAALGVVAALLPQAAGAPLYGRRVVRLGLAGWFGLGALALPQGLVPELLPTWLIRPVEAAALALVVPATLLGVMLLGTLVGARRNLWARSGLPGLWIARLALAGGVLLLAEIVCAAALPPGARRLVQLSAWDPATGLAPPLAGLWLVAIAAGYALSPTGGADVAPARLRGHAWLAIGAALLCVLPLPIVGLAGAAAEVARVLGVAGLEGTSIGGAALLRAEAWLRLPGMILLWCSAALWLAKLRRAPAPADLPEEPWARGGEPALAPTMLAGVTLALLGAGLFVVVFLPLVDPAALSPGPRASARTVEAGSLRDEGRRRYVAEGCLACHTQRVRDAADGMLFGPQTTRGDYAPGPALAGQRRAGPDLAWVGDRFDGDALAARLSEAHGPRGTPALLWLFEAGGPTPEGMAVAAYLAGLRAEAVDD